MSAMFNIAYKCGIIKQQMLEAWNKMFHAIVYHSMYNVDKSSGT